MAINEQEAQEFHIKKEVELKRKQKKENLTLGSVGNSLTKLISKLQSADNNGECITPESSNSPSESESQNKVFSEKVVEDDSTDSDSDDVDDVIAATVDEISIVIEDISNNNLSTD